MKKLLVCTVAAMLVMSFLVAADSSAWHGKKGAHWVYKGVTNVENNPGVKEYVWETERPPYGPFDKIALHRLVKETKNWWMIPYGPAPDKKKVIFIIPGTWSRGGSKLTDERHSLNIFLANHGYDVYSMDFRTNYVSNFAYDQFEPYGIDVSSTADWTYGVFREDIKTCIEKAKRISRAKKLFLAGRSRGGTQMFIYASKYPEDLKGLISLDGGGKITPPSGTQMTQEEYEAFVDNFKATGVLLAEVSGYEQSHYAGQVPYALNTPGFESLDDYALYVKQLYPWADYPPPSPIETVSDAVAYGAHYAWGAGKVTNYYGGFIELDVLIAVEANFTRYWPEIQNIEGSQLNAYSGGDCPFLDYDDNLADLPMIAFLSELFCPGGLCLYLPDNKTLSEDVTFIYLPGYGHLDVYVGVNSISDVKQPLLEWMNDRR